MCIERKYIIVQQNGNIQNICMYDTSKCIFSQLNLSLYYECEEYK